MLSFLQLFGVILMQDQILPVHMMQYRGSKCSNSIVSGDGELHRQEQQLQQTLWRQEWAAAIVGSLTATPWYPCYVEWGIAKGHLGHKCHE